MSLGGQRGSTGGQSGLHLWVRVSGASFLGKGGLRSAHPLDCSSPVSSLTPHTMVGCAEGFPGPCGWGNSKSHGLVGGPRGVAWEQEASCDSESSMFPTVPGDRRGHEEPPMGPQEPVTGGQPT